MNSSYIHTYIHSYIHTCLQRSYFRVTCHAVCHGILYTQVLIISFFHSTCVVTLSSFVVNKVLTLLGVGLMFVSVSAFRNVNQTPSDAADRAFLNTIEKHTSQMLKLLFLPLDFLAACKDALVGILLFPFRVLLSSLTRAGKLGESLLASVQNWFLWFLYLPTQILSSLLSSSRNIFETTYTNLIHRFSRLMCAANTSFASVLFQKATQQLSGAANRTKIQWVILNHHVSDNLLCVERFGKQTSQAIKTTLDGVFAKLTRVQDDVTKFTILLQRERKGCLVILSKGYHSLNQTLATFAFFVEESVRRIARIF